MTDLIFDSTATPQTPAITLPLHGQHLIEASAGTGKTWTLTGIVLRLLIQADYECHQIIASTFTRSASAEMRKRILDRLTDMQKLLGECTNAFRKITGDRQDNRGLFTETVALTNQSAEQTYHQFQTILVALVEQKGLSKIFADPINAYLIDWIAKQEFGLTTPEVSDNDSNNSKNSSKPATPSDTPQPPAISANTKPVNFSLAYNRTLTAITGLDRLFVGTLDSLCQKWLQEFSAETGYQPTIRISNNVENIILAMIHDQLRAFRSTVGEHEPEVFKLMYATNRLPKAEDFLKAVDKALNFYSTLIDVFVPKKFDLAPLQALLERLKYADSEALQPYADSAFRLEQGMAEKGILHTRFADGLAIQKHLNQQGILGLLQLSKGQNEWLEKVALCVENEKDKSFNSKAIEQRQAFIAIPLIQLYAQLYQAYQALTHHMDDLNQYFHRFICDYVRQQLPVVLEAQQMTTFSLQLARLNHALNSKQGESLARYIRHQYPVALIDESQDINTEQAMLIQRIYLPQNSLSNTKILEKNKTDIKTNQRQFLLLVGDPKQAIYGFRGGDVGNYNQLKAQFPNKPQELIESRRSAPAVIEALNHWFGKPSEEQTFTNENDKGEALPKVQQAYFLGENIHYRHIQASRKSSDIWLGGGIDEQGDYVEGQRDEGNAVYLLNIGYQQALPTENPITESKADGENPSKNATENEATLDFNEAVTAQILALMDSEHPLGYQLENGKVRPLRLSDIGILADKNKQLDSLEQALQARNIATSRGGSQSVFAGEMAQDLITLMQAMLYPYDLTRLRSLLLSHFFGLSLADIAQYDTQSNKQSDEQDDEQQKTLEKTHQSEGQFTLLADIQYLITEAGKLWQRAGFLTAIQWLLNQKVTLANMEINFWQRLAQVTHDNRQKSGERLLIDLRQLLDIISQMSQGIGNEMGEYQLLEWLEQQHDEQPKEEWSMQQRLPSDEAVQLMTIHNSKGLEFPIVFVVGLDKAISQPPQKYQLFLYADEKMQNLHNRRLSPVPYQHRTAGKSDDYFKTIEHLALYEEKLRLAYVALTRCRDRLYIVVEQRKPVKSESKTPSCIPLEQWLNRRDFALPSHLAEQITQVDLNSLSKYFNPNYHHLHQDNHPDKTTDYPNWQATIKMTEFIGWTNTSFTALARHLQHDKLDVAINQPDYLFENDSPPTVINLEAKSKPQFDPQFNDWINSVPMPEMVGNSIDYDDFIATEFLTDPDLIDDLPSQTIRFTFEKGTNAGIFLHKILEILPPITHPEWDESHQLLPETFKTWTPIIDRAVTTHQIAPEFLSNFNQESLKQNDLGQMDNSPQPDEQGQENAISPQHLELARWLYDITQTPFLASELSLAQIPANQKISELSFDMSLKQTFSIEAVNKLYQQIGISLNLNKHGQAGHYWRYLKGEIDLVYQAGEQGRERFFVVDYKSNYLGNQFNFYDKQAMEQAMNEHGYWLQAGIYQVALHRYLSLRLPNYAIEKHLGAVEYVFLRGMSPDYPTQGRLVCDKLTLDFILKLDEILGNARMDDKL